MSNKKNITTKTTIENLAVELKKKFAAQNVKFEEQSQKLTEQAQQITAHGEQITAHGEQLTQHGEQIAKAFKSGKVEGNTVNFYTAADQSGEAAFSVDFPTEMFLDQTKTTFVPSFTWSEETYPGSENPSMEKKPVLVLAVKGSDDTCTYSFLNMAKLVDTYAAKNEGKDASTAVTVEGYEIEVKVNISSEAGNALVLKEDGLYVASPKVDGATAGNFAALDAEGNVTDSGKKPSDYIEKVVDEDGQEDVVIHASDIVDYTTEEIAALLADDE